MLSQPNLGLQKLISFSIPCVQQNNHPKKKNNNKFIKLYNRRSTVTHTLTTYLELI